MKFDHHYLVIQLAVPVFRYVGHLFPHWYFFSFVGFTPSLINLIFIFCIPALYPSAFLVPLGLQIMTQFSSCNTVSNLSDWVMINT